MWRRRVWPVRGSVGWGIGFAPPGVVAAEVVRGKAQAAAPGTAGGLFTKAVYNGRLSGNDETMNVPQLMRHIEECT